MYWEKDIETLGRDGLNKMTLTKLNQMLSTAIKSPYYQKKLKDFDIPNQPIKSLKDFQRLPFTEKQDLRDHFPDGLLCCSKEEIIRMHSSSGTTGNPTVVYHTKKDIETWANLMARSLYMAGVRRRDVFQNIMGYGLFTGGLGFHYGVEKLGAMIIPIGTGNSKRQLWFMKEFQTSVLHILPNYALRLHMVLKEEKIKLEDLNLRIACIGSEPHTEETRRKIEELYKIKAYNSYGLSEMNGPGVAFECTYQSGMHVWEDAFYPEIIDPQTGEVLPDGEWGELVFTTLQREAMPILRYRTKDLTRIIPGACPCGRHHRRIDRIKGRSDDMLIINGVNIFPMQIEQKLMQFEEVGSNYIIEIRNENYLEKIHIKVEIKPEYFGGTLTQLESLKGRIIESLKAEITVSPVVQFVEPGTLPDFAGKAQRVFDLRNKE